MLTLIDALIKKCRFCLDPNSFGKLLPIEFGIAFGGARLTIVGQSLDKWPCRGAYFVPTRNSNGLDALKAVPDEW